MQRTIEMANLWYQDLKYWIMECEAQEIVANLARNDLDMTETVLEVK